MAQRRHPVDDVMHVREPTDCKAFCLKYFCEGQRLEASLEELVYNLDTGASGGGGAL